MRITSLETIPVGLPFRERYVTATGSLERREMIVVRLRDDEGRVGCGDAVPLSLRGGPGLAVVRDDLEERCGPALIGASPDAGAGVGSGKRLIGELLDACLERDAGPQALAAVDAALLDLLGKLLEVPAWSLLGAEEARAVECNGTLGAGDPESVAAAAGALVAAGFGTLKVKVGTGEDRGRLRAVREAAGAEVRLRVDANRAWSVDEAEAELTAMGEEVGLELAEQPCRGLEELAQLRRRIEVPVVADESVASVGEAERAFALGACDAVTLKLAKVGGARAALRAAAAGPAYLSSALDSSIGIAAAAHAAQALAPEGFAAGLAHGLATSSLFTDNVADPAHWSGPRIEPPQAPGLGVEVDEAALQRLRLP